MEELLGEGEGVGGVDCPRRSAGWKVMWVIQGRTRTDASIEHDMHAGKTRRHTHTHTRARTHARTHRHTHTRAHTHTHTHTASFLIPQDKHTHTITRADIQPQAVTHTNAHTLLLIAAFRYNTLGCINDEIPKDTACLTQLGR